MWPVLFVSKSALINFCHCVRCDGMSEAIPKQIGVFNLLFVTLKQPPEDYVH